MNVAITTAETDEDLEAIVRVRSVATPKARATVEDLRFRLGAKEEFVYLVARVDNEAVACGFVEPWTDVAASDVAVVPAHRRRGVGTSMLAEVSARARAFGRDALQGEVKASDRDSRAFLEHRGFVQVGAENAVVLELERVDPPDVDPPPGVRIVSRVEEPDRLRAMYAVAVQADEDIPGSGGVQTFDQWRAHEIDSPARRPQFCFLALAGDDVVGYAALQVFGHEAFHGLTATRRDWRRRGVAAALKRAEIAAAKCAGFARLLTESEERNEPMRRLNEKLGYRPAPEWSTIVMRAPLT